MTLLYDDAGNRTRLSRLADRGVRVWGPERVYVGADVHLDRIFPGAELINASISGANTFIGSKAQIGGSGLARIHESLIGSGSILGAGTYEHCVLLPNAKARGYAEFRPGTVLEEGAETGHNVGLKHTVFTVGVVAGSLINFCDVVLTGGSSRRDHSEVGSGVVHFNYDARGDKFGSLMGDANGCLLRSRRIFVGGNSGIVAPVRMEFGSVIAAGSLIRKDVEKNQLASGNAAVQGRDYDLDRYFDLSRKFLTTARLIGTLEALCAWYRCIRLPFADSEGAVLYPFAELEFARHMKWRCQELLKVVDKLEKSLSKPCATDRERSFHKQHRRILENRASIASLLLREDWPLPPASLVAEYGHLRQSLDHVGSVRALSAQSTKFSATWLDLIADRSSVVMQTLFRTPTSD